MKPLARRCLPALPTLAAVAWLILAGVAAPVHAGLFTDDEAHKKIEQLRSDLNEANTKLETVSRNQLGFANQVESIKSDIAKLRGQIEELTYNLDAAQKRQKDFYVDLDNRLRKIEQGAGDAAKADTAKLDPAAETRDYEAALALLKVSKFKEAGTGFLAFIKAWPKSTLQASAHYWGGYAHAQGKDYAKAAELFGKFATDWPTDERAPVALESQASALEMTKDAKGAKAALEILIEKYPTSESAKRAKQKLKRR